MAWFTNAWLLSVAMPRPPTINPAVAAVQVLQHTALRALSHNIQRDLRRPCTIWTLAIELKRHMNRCSGRCRQPRVMRRRLSKRAVLLTHLSDIVHSGSITAGAAASLRKLTAQPVPKFQMSKVKLKRMRLPCLHYRLACSISLIKQAVSC